MHTLVCLHGWGGSEESFDALRNALSDTDLRILSPDLPGFGEESDPDKPWNTDDYAQWAAAYIREHVEGPYALLGHSHGGRISLKLVTSVLQQTKTPLPTHLYLCAAAGIRHPKHVKRAIGFVMAKAGKCILSIPGMKSLEPIGKKLLYKLMGVHDYEKASDVMKRTLIEVSKEDLRPILSSIAVPTDIFWGTDDTLTPLSDSKTMHAEIEGSNLHVFQHARHRIHRNNAKEIAEVIRTTL